MRSIGGFRRMGKDLEGLCVEFMDELKPVWDNDQEALKVLREMRGVLSEIDTTLNLLNAGLNRLEEIRIRERRGRLKVLKGLGKASG